MNDYISKPIQSARLIAVVERWTDARRKNDTVTAEVPAATTPAVANTMDFGELESLAARIGGHKIRELIADFIEDSSRQMTHLAELCAKGDHQAIAALAHEIAGSSANYGANELAERAHALNALTSDAPDPDIYAGQAADIEDCATRSWTALHDRFIARG